MGKSLSSCQSSHKKEDATCRKTFPFKSEQNQAFRNTKKDNKHKQTGTNVENTGDLYIFIHPLSQTHIH